MFWKNFVFLINTICFIFYPIFKVVTFFKYKTIKKYKVPINQQKKIKNLIWLDFDAFIGDFFIGLNECISFYKSNKSTIIIANEKFKGVLERFGVEPRDIIYKTTFDTKNIKNIYDFFFWQNISCEKIFYPNIILTVEFLISTFFINFNEIIKIDFKLIKRNRLSSYINFRDLWNSLFLMCWYNKKCVSNKKINYYNKENIFEQFYGVKSIDICNSSNYTDKIIFSMGASRKSKVLKSKKICDILKQKKMDFSQIIFVGTQNDIEYKDRIEKFIGDKINFKSNITLIDLITLVERSKLVISYDTGLMHIAKFLNKDVVSLINKNFISWSVDKRFWFSKYPENECRIVMNKRNFL